MSGGKGDKPKTLATAKSAPRPAATSQPEKRPASDMDNSSFGDEITMINRQLEQLTEDTKATRDKVKNMLSKDELKDFIRTTVSSMIKELEDRLQAEIEKKVQEKHKEKTTEMSDRLDSLTLENVQLRERLDEAEKQIKDNEALAQKTMQKSNYNEQYSRKNNIKIMGVPEEREETVEMLADNTLSILYGKAGVAVDPRNVVAIHRIPGKAGMPKPVLMKMSNNHEKTKIMKKRKEMKAAGFRLVDDVTKMNTELINRLSLHENIDSAWYFNGSVFGKTTEGKRHKFDIFSNIGKIIRKSDAADDGSSN